jgi:hypothetical protein
MGARPECDSGRDKNVTCGRVERGRPDRIGVGLVGVLGGVHHQCGGVWRRPMCEGS